MKHSKRGFTLIELMITVAIVGIIAAIAYPNYIDQVRKSRRSEARSALLQAANRQERYYTTQYEYADKLAKLGINDPSTENKFYKLQIDNADAKTFKMSAKAQGDQVNDDCTTLSIDNLGDKTANVAGVCW